MTQFSAACLEHDGYFIVTDVVDRGTLQHLLSAVSVIADVSGDFATRKISGGVRNLLSVLPEVRSLAETPMLRNLVTPSLGNDAVAVRAILFDKTPDSNWKVPWHQDLTIAVRERREVAGFGPWTVKEGVNNVQPPPKILEGMLSVRVHLDDCDVENGPLRVLPFTHLSGRLDAPTIQRLREEIQPIPCLAGAGDVVLMRPLLLHASSAATSPAHRRVIHIDYAAASLPFSLEWNERYPVTGQS